MPLYVPLDVDFASDAKFLAAGPLAGYLYISSLALAKRTQSDGRIEREQLAVIALGIPKPQPLAETLVKVGLWDETQSGWQITSWLKRNKSKAQLEQDREKKRLAAVKANHTRWHADEPSGDCPFCDPVRIDPPIGTPIESGIQVKEKSEGESEGETAPERVPTHHDLLRPNAAPPLFQEVDDIVAVLVHAHGADAVSDAVRQLTDQRLRFPFPSSVRAALEAVLGPLPADAKPTVLDETARAQVALMERNRRRSSGAFDCPKCEDSGVCEVEDAAGLTLVDCDCKYRRTA